MGLMMWRWCVCIAGVGNWSGVTGTNGGCKISEARQRKVRVSWRRLGVKVICVGVGEDGGHGKKKNTKKIQKNNVLTMVIDGRPGKKKG